MARDPVTIVHTTGNLQRPFALLSQAYCHGMTVQKYFNAIEFLEYYGIHTTNFRTGNRKLGSQNVE